jgi:signal transduction histidine kinase
MELGRLERSPSARDSRVRAAIVECRQLVDTVVRSVRDLALGLRPSMLDDFGLQPALEWLVRDVSRRSGANVELSLQGDLGRLPDQYLTCVYRVVQEALTNCIRHAHARSIDVAVVRQSDGLQISISDDGVGLPPDRRRGGFGLRGVEERAKELHGTLTIESSPGSGTTIAVRLPEPIADRDEVALARSRACSSKTTCAICSRVD